MSSPPAGIPDADWLLWPPEARAFILAQQQEIEQLRSQLAALATELARLRERIGRSSRNSSKPPSSDGPGFKPPARRKGSGRKRGGQPGHPGSGPELLPIERVDEVVEHHPDACRHCGTLLEGEDPDPLRHLVIEIPPITPLVIEHRLHRLICPCCSTSTCAPLPADVEVSRYGRRLSFLIALLGAAFPLSISKSQALLQQVLGVEQPRASIVRSLQRVSAALEQPTTAAHRALQQQPVVYVGNRRPHRQCRVSDRFSAYNHLPSQQRQLCWAHLIRDLTAIAGRSGASAAFGAQLLELQQQLFEQWHRYKGGTIDWPALQHSSQPIRLAFVVEDFRAAVATLQQVVELGIQRGERTPWASTVRTCQKLLKVADALWTFLETEGIEPTNNAAERALRPAVIQRKVSHGVQSANGAICRARLLTVTTTLRQQGRDVWQFLEQAWIAHHHGGVMPSLLPDP